MQIPFTSINVDDQEKALAFPPAVVYRKVLFEAGIAGSFPSGHQSMSFSAMDWQLSTSSSRDL